MAAERSFPGFVLSAAIVAVFFSASAADDQPVKPPYIEVGDCWSYRADNVEERSRINEYEECVTFVDRGKDVIFAVAKLKDSGREIETSYTATMASRTNLEGTIFTYAEGQEMFKWPLRDRKSTRLNSSHT